MLAKVDRVEVVGPYRLAVGFRDGSSGVHDFEEMVMAGRGLLVALRDPAFFSRVFLDYGALTWPNDFDISPEWLRREMAAAGELTANAAAE